jgi:hypothetical protein
MSDSPEPPALADEAAVAVGDAEQDEREGMDDAPTEEVADDDDDDDAAAEEEVVVMTQQDRERREANIAAVLKGT